MTIAVSLMLALALSIIINFILADKLQDAETSNEEMMIENNELRARIGELMIDKRVRHDVAEILGGKEKC